MLYLSSQKCVRTRVASSELAFCEFLIEKSFLQLSIARSASHVPCLLIFVY